MKVELFISDASGTRPYLPIIEEGIEWSTERRSTPGKLTFQVLNDKMIDIQEGAAVRLTVDNHPIFFGFVFTKKRTKEPIITVTAYDQLRYLNNKDTYVYENKTASQVIQTIATKFSLNLGVIEDTKFVIASRIEENTSLFDMIETALDITLRNRKEIFVFYDDFGKLTLRNLSSMRVGEAGYYVMLDAETGENFDYSSSIDTTTYNKIKLTFDNEETGKRDVYIAQDGKHMNEWGILQYFDTLKDWENGKAKADALLKLYNQKTRRLKITNCLGDPRVRAGSLIFVTLALGDVTLNNFMLVEKCKHTFKENEHRMEVILRGGDFVG